MTPVEDYPSDLVDFEKRFATEQACRDYLVQLRWPQGFRCSRCGSDKSWPTGRDGLVECARCHHQTTVIAGTIFEGTRKPLSLWLRAMRLITSQKNGISVLALQRQLGLTRYETVWTWLHKLRRAMVRPGRERLSRKVEVDEFYLGGDETGVHGRETASKALVVVAAEIDGRRTGRIRLRHVPDASSESLIPFIEETIEPGAEVYTDGWSSFWSLESKGYNHKVTVIKRSSMQAYEVMPRVHSVASLLKRWWIGTHQGSMGDGHLDYYLDEFTFRFNRRTSRKRGKLFYRLVQQALEVDPVYWADVALGSRISKINKSSDA